MKKTTKLLIVTILISAVLIGLGFLLGGSIKGVNNTINTNADYDFKTVNIDDNVNVLKLTTKLENIVVVKSTTNKSFIEFYEHKSNSQYKEILTNNELSLNFGTKMNSKFPWISYKYPSKDVFVVKVYVDDTKLQSLDIVYRYGNININSLDLSNTLKANSLKGNINIKDVKTTNLIDLSAKLNAYITAVNVETTKLNMTSKLGNVNLENNLSSQTSIRTSTGKIVVKEDRARTDLSIVIKVKISLTKIDLFGTKVKTVNDLNTANLPSYTINTTLGSVKVNDLTRVL